MSRSRLEAFSDGVIAILITIMVLGLSQPRGADLDALLPLWPVFLCYVLSFLYLGIYWNNHHHLLKAAEIVDGRVLWANLHLLFWLSLVPFGTTWMGEQAFAPVPTATYGVILLMAALAYYLLVQALIAVPGQARTLAVAIGADRKGTLSALAYALAIPLALAASWLGVAIYLAVAVIWVVPDRRIERTLPTGGARQP